MLALVETVPHSWTMVALVEMVPHSWRMVALVEMVLHTNWTGGGQAPDTVRQRSRLLELSSCWTALAAN